MDKRCSVCILPANLPGVTLDKEDKCNYCRDFERNPNKYTDVPDEKAKQKFESIIARLRGKGDYDCLVPSSGGKDSSYILYTLVKNYNLKVLAFNFDNSFQHPQAVKNIHTLVNKLGVDLVVYKPSQDMMRKLFKTFLSKSGEFCTPCNMLISATKFRIAQQHRISAIMSGSFKKVDPGIAGLSPALYFDRKYYFTIAKDLLSKREEEHYVVRPYPLTALQRAIGTAPQNIDVLNYLRPSFSDMEKTLKEIGWERPQGAMQHGDCLVNPIKEYIIYKKWGCSELTGLYCALIRNGEMSREEALKKAHVEEQIEIPAILPEFLRAIGMTESEFEESLKKDFREIPNMRSTAYFKLARKIVMMIARLRGRVYR